MWFKLAFGAAFVSVAYIATSTARRAARTHGGELNQMTSEVPGLLAVRGALGLVFYSILMAWLFLPGTLRWTYVPIAPPLQWLGVVLLVPVIAFFAWSFRSIGDAYRGGVGLHDAHSLVTTGAYRYVRHPIYIAFIGLMLVVLLISANWLLGLSGLALVSAIPAARIPIEERQLHERFGAAWEAYRDRTGRMFPRFRP
ncbi:MAG: isoprenylcysteine carboxylmethyltransferase family protein [Tepidisphaeraceae bacterium]